MTIKENHYGCSALFAEEKQEQKFMTTQFLSNFLYIAPSAKKKCG